MKGHGNLELVVNAEIENKSYVETRLNHSISNPVLNFAVLTITPNVKGAFSIALYDHSGQSVEINLGYMEAGNEYGFELDLSVLKEGVGFYVIKSKSSIESGVLIIK